MATHAEADDADYDASSAVTVTLADGASTASTATASRSRATSSPSPRAGTYVVSGTLTDGQVVVDSDAEGKVRIVLDGAVDHLDLHVTVRRHRRRRGRGGAGRRHDQLAERRQRLRRQRATPTTRTRAVLDGRPDHHRHRRPEVTGNSNDGIASKDGLVIQSGTITVTAKDDGIRGKDYLVIKGGTITVDARRRRPQVRQRDRRHGRLHLGDGGTVTVTAGDDGAHAEGDLSISDGTVTVAKSERGAGGRDHHAVRAAPTTSRRPTTASTCPTAPAPARRAAAPVEVADARTTARS